MRGITFIKFLNEVSKISWFTGKYTEINLQANFSVLPPTYQLMWDMSISTASVLKQVNSGLNILHF